MFSVASSSFYERPAVLLRHRRWGLASVFERLTVPPKKDNCSPYWVVPHCIQSQAIDKPTHMRKQLYEVTMQRSHVYLAKDWFSTWAVETHVLLKWLLGLPLFNSEDTCPYCTSQLDPAPGTPCFNLSLSWGCCDTSQLTAYVIVLQTTLEQGCMWNNWSGQRQVVPLLTFWYLIDHCHDLQRLLLKLCTRLLNNSLISLRNRSDLNGSERTRETW